MQLDQTAYDRQTQAQSGALTIGARVALTKSIEYEGQEFGLDPKTGVANGDFDVRGDPLRVNLDAPILGRELDRIGEQIPEDLPQPIRVTGHWARCGVEQNL